MNPAHACICLPVAPLASYWNQNNSMASLINPNKRAAEDLCGSADVNVGDGAASASRKIAKRAMEATPTKPDNLHLPAPVWGHVLDYMPYEEVRSALLVYRMIANDAVRYVHFLNITTSSQMHVRAARRFPNVEELNCSCLIKLKTGPLHADDDIPPPPETPHTLSEDTATRLVPFICAFTKIHTVMAMSEGYFYEDDGCTGPENHREIFEALIKHILGAYKAGAMPRHLDWLCGIIDAMACPKVHHTGLQSSPCRRCQQICKYFPWRNLCAVDVEPGLLCLSQLEMYTLLTKRPDSQQLFEEKTPELLMGYVEMHELMLGSPDDDWRKSAESKALIEKLEKFGVERIGMRVQWLSQQSLKNVDKLIAIGFDPGKMSTEYIHRELGFEWGGTTNHVYTKGSIDALLSRGFALDLKRIIILNEKEEPVLEKYINSPYASAPEFPGFIFAN